MFWCKVNCLEMNLYQFDDGNRLSRCCYIDRGLNFCWSKAWREREWM
jgi:hypothetical protein